jgi:hypothetical protein
MLTAHVLGDKTPEVTVRWVTQDGKSGTFTGQFRIGTYSPDLQNRSVYGNVDCDGGTHTNALEDPLGVALFVLDHLDQLGIVAYLEKSGSGTGWKPWTFFDESVPAWKIRKVLHACTPKDAKIRGGGFADSRAGTGIEIFPKQDEHADSTAVGAVGNQTWCPFWSGAKDGGNQFYRVEAGELVLFVPDIIATNTEADLDAALKQIPDETKTKTKTVFKLRAHVVTERDPNGRVSTGTLLDRALKRASPGTSTGRNNTGAWLARQLRDNGYT